MSIHDDEDLRRSWASLLANASTTGVRVAYATILMDLEPQDARLLNLLYSNDVYSRQQRHSADRPWIYGNVRLTYHPNHSFTIDPSTSVKDKECFGVLEKHNLISKGPELATGQSYMITDLGRNFRSACSPPQTKPEAGAPD